MYSFFLGSFSDTFFFFFLRNEMESFSPRANLNLSEYDLVHAMSGLYYQANHPHTVNLWPHGGRSHTHSGVHGWWLYNSTGVFLPHYHCDHSTAPLQIFNCVTWTWKYLWFEDCFRYVNLRHLWDLQVWYPVGNWKHVLAAQGRFLSWKYEIRIHQCYIAIEMIKAEEIM